MDMDIELNDHVQRFYVAIAGEEKWKPVLGYRVNVGDYQFCVAPMGNIVRVSEVTSGARIMDLPFELVVDPSVPEDTDISPWIYKIGKQIREMIRNIDGLDTIIANKRQAMIALLGDKPGTEHVKANEI